MNQKMMESLYVGTGNSATGMLSGDLSSTMHPPAEDDDDNQDHGKYEVQEAPSTRRNPSSRRQRRNRRGFFSSTSSLTSSVNCWMSYSKAIVCFVLVASAVAVGLLSWLVLSRHQADDFAAHYHESAAQVVHLSTKRTRDSVAQLQSLAGYTASYAMAAGDTFPNVTLPVRTYTTNTLPPKKERRCQAK